MQLRESRNTTAYFLAYKLYQLHHSAIKIPDLKRTIETGIKNPLAIHKTILTAQKQVIRQHSNQDVTLGAVCQAQTIE